MAVPNLPSPWKKVPKMIPNTVISEVYGTPVQFANYLINCPKKRQKNRKNVTSSDGARWDPSASAAGSHWQEFTVAELSVELSPASESCLLRPPDVEVAVASKVAASQVTALPSDKSCL